MARRMLIDATHPEETRVVVINGTKLEEFDFETSTKKQIKGNIYLAKITRVEPSLQAAFVEYGGNRHGFLSFSEIHPDYYRIPVSDREALIASEEPDSEEGDLGNAPFGDNAEEGFVPDTDVPDEASLQANVEPTLYEPAEQPDIDNPESDDLEEDSLDLSEEPSEDVSNQRDADEPAEPPATVDTLGGDDLYDLEPEPRARHYRSYKIQEVIKRRQILLVQVTKEERGTKGAALTTYLSLAGRYCVLMPNAGRGGGVSRKITSIADRRRLRDLMDELGVPDGMGVIVRTAGSERSQTEIKRDYEYLLRLWDDIRELTLRSSAPALIYEEGNLIKRAIRDLFTRDIDEILVEGAEGYRTAKEFMRMLTPGSAARVRAYRDVTIPLLHRYQVDAQIDQIHNPVVQLKSGGYIVINPTEALVSIDVNSGRATRERNIEETATKTNIEAAEEIARQLRLRDLAGLVVIDFIDMEESRNQKLVEHKMKDAMKSDRARIQVGRISAFGLLELSRQRLRSSLIEASTQPCPHCNGTGNIRSTESTALVILRALEEEGIRRRTAEVTIFVPTHIALYLLNQKRDAVTLIEGRYGFRVTISNDDLLIPPAYRLERMRTFTPDEIEALPTAQPDPEPHDEIEDPIDEPDELPQGEIRSSVHRDRDDDNAKAAAEGGETGPRKRRRRRRRRGGESAEGSGEQTAQTDDAIAEDDVRATESEEGEPGAADQVAATETGAEADTRKRRRGRRGGRRRRREEGALVTENATEEQSFEDDYPSPFDFASDGRVQSFEDAPPAQSPDIEKAADASTDLPAVDQPAPAQAEDLPAPKRKRAPRRKAELQAEPVAEVPEAVVADAAEPASKPRRTRKPKSVEPEFVESVTPTEEPAPEVIPAEVAEAAIAETAPEEPPEAESEDRPRKTGWWRRLVSAP